MFNTSICFKNTTSILEIYWLFFPTFQFFFLVVFRLFSLMHEKVLSSTLF